MKALVQTALLSISLALSTLSVAQLGSAGSSGAVPSQGAARPKGNAGSGAMAASSDLKILSPTDGQKIGSTALSVRYEITNTSASAAASPTFQLQLDGRDPVETMDTEYGFTGLAPGKHAVTVELVDANHTPIVGSQAIVHFVTFTPGVGKNPTSELRSPYSPKVIKAAMPIPSSKPSETLPAAAGELPLLSMVGFGVLVGGVISAMRTRKL
jgi:hypothetical protein